MTLRDVDSYLKRKALAEHPSTPAAEARSARDQMAAMEKEQPDITLRAAAVEAALHREVPGFDPNEFFGARAPAAAPPPATNPVTAFIDGIFKGAAREFADTVAGEVSGASRHDALAPEQVVTRRMACAKGQVCIEVRANKKDMKRRFLREQVMDRIEDLLTEG